MNKMFTLKNKIALISGGASGIGLQTAKELLRNGLKGITLADINSKFGEKALEEISTEFGPDKAIFVKTDVSNYRSYEAAFQQTIKKFYNLDILINNAAIFNDAAWDKEIAVNINGVVHGMHLGLENYIPKYKSDSEGLILNMSSIAGIEAFAHIPIYTATKFAVLGMSKSFGDRYHYKRTKIKVVALCPGVTQTALLTEASGKTFGQRYEELLAKTTVANIAPTQSTEVLAVGLVKVLKVAQSGSAWVVEGGEDPYEYTLNIRKTVATK